MKLINLECAELGQPKVEGGSHHLNDIMDICFRFDGIEVDLHNHYDFAGFEYDPVQRSAIFRWKGNPPEDAETDYERAMPEHFAIRFNGIWHFSMTPRDSAYPPESDLGTSNVYLTHALPTEEPVKELNWPQGVSDNLFVIELESEICFEIYAESLERINF